MKYIGKDLNYQYLEDECSKIVVIYDTNSRGISNTSTILIYGDINNG